MTGLVLLAVVVSALNTILLAAVIFILKQPDPTRGKHLAELQEQSERITELMKAMVSIEKKLENAIKEARTESISKLDRINQDFGRQLKSIHDNL